jgi:hypothetical protein
VKGRWVYDPNGDIWHLLWDGRPWCRRDDDWKDLNWPDKPGSEVGWNDTLHDECVRKSEDA